MELSASGPITARRLTVAESGRVFRRLVSMTIAREVASRAIVMLTNRRNTLPLSATVKRLAVIGPLADSSIDMRGPWWGASAEIGHVTVLEGLRAGFPDLAIQHALGVAVDGDDVGG